jgi:hypothetical protein
VNVRAQAASWPRREHTSDRQRMMELAEWSGLRVDPVEPRQPTVRAALRLD